MSAIADAAERLWRAKAIAVLTGAGVSAESGVPTFRGEGGLWRQFRAEDLATPEAFARDPRLVWEWYDWRRQKIAACRPNPAHHALAALEARGGEFLLVTQNIDDLHRKAGSRRLVELHGNIWRARCTREGTLSDLPEVPLRAIPPRCDCGALLRPDTVRCRIWAYRAKTTHSPRGEFERGGGPPLSVGPAGRAPRLLVLCKRGSLPRERSGAATLSVQLPHR